MTTEVVTVLEEMLLTDVVRLLLKWRVSGLPVVDERGELKGLVTEHDLVNFIVSGNAAVTRVSEVMTRDVKTYTPETSFIDIVNDFMIHRVRRIPIVESGRLVGIVSRRDIIREMARTYDLIVGKKEETAP